MDNSYPTPRPSLLSIVELGGYPDFSALYAAAGFEVTTVRSMRAALASLKRLRPAAVVAEFIYGPVYGSRISNFESLMAGLQCHSPQAKLIALVERQDLPHLERLLPRFPVFETLHFPIVPARLADCLARAARAAIPDGVWPAPPGSC